MHRTTRTTPFSLKLSRESPRPLTLPKARLTNEEYSNPPPQHAKTRALSRLHHLMHAVEKESAKARQTYSLNFDWRVRHTRPFNEDHMVFVANPPATKCRQKVTSAEEDPSIKSKSEKSGPYQAIRATPHTVPIDIDRLHDSVAIDRVTLPQTAEEVSHDANRRSCDSRSPSKHRTTLKKPHTRDLVMREKTKLAPKDDGLSPTVHGEAVRTELNNRYTPTGVEEEK